MGKKTIALVQMVIQNISNNIFNIFRKYIIIFFNVQGENEMTETLLKRLNKSGKVHMVPASLKGKYVIRFTVTSQYTTDQDIERDWKIISDTATKVSLTPVTKI